MARQQTDLLQGTLELLILKALSLEPMHGWGITQRLQEMSDEVFQINQGSLYPALQRMRRRGWMASEWRATPTNRKARYYELTPAGEAALREARNDWERASMAVNRVLRWAGREA